MASSSTGALVAAGSLQPFTLAQKAQIGYITEDENPKGQKAQIGYIKEDENPNPRRSLAGLLFVVTAHSFGCKKQDTGTEYGETGHRESVIS
jgi:hypothetical protein